MTSVKDIILVADDTRESLSQLKKLLAGEDFQVFPADSGELALASVAAHKPDLILLNIHMPGIDGFEVCRRLKSSKETRDIPVLFLMAATEVKERVEGLRLGAADCISQPFLPEECLARVKTHLEKSKSHAQLQKRMEELAQANGLLQLEIAEHNKEKENLKKSENRYRDIALHTQEWIWEIDTHGRYTYSNQMIEKVLGYSPEEIIQKHFYELFHPEDMESLKASSLAAFASKQPFVSFVNRNIHKNGHAVWLETSGFPAFDEKGHWLGYRGVDVDITKRRRVEEALRESEYFFRESQRSAFIGSYKTDFNSDSWSSSEVLDQIFGIARDYRRTIQGWLDIVHPDDRDMMSGYLKEEVLTSRNAFDKEYRIVRKNNGETRWVYGRGKLEFDGQDNRLSLIGTIQDITARKQIEEEKAKLETQLRQAQKMESIGRLAGGVAHDFNNMLGVIIGHSEIALSQLDPAQPLFEDLSEIRNAAERSASLTRQLLAFARKQTAMPRILDLNETVAGMFNMLQRLIGENINLNWHPAEILWPVKIDPGQIDQILANLTVNARDAITGVGKITIETKNCFLDEVYCAAHPGVVPGDYIMLALSDDGCGMDQDTLSHIFEPFFSTKGIGKGTGLGLATIYGIVRQNNGYIHVCSEPGHGSTFTIYLPRHLDQAEEGARKEVLPQPVRGSETILLVEDELSLLKLTQRILEQQGYTILAASSPGEAIRISKERSGEIHMLLTDVVMPDMNGWDLAKNLKLIYPHIRSLFMSGYTSDIIASNGVLDEGIPFIQKPFASQSLATKIREVLDNA